METPQDDYKLSVRLPRGLAERLRLVAEAERRTLQATAEIAIERYVNDKEAAA